MALETKIEADTELIKNRLWLKLNLLYKPETTRAATLGLSTAVAFQIIPKVTVGTEMSYLRCPL